MSATRSHPADGRSRPRRLTGLRRVLTALTASLLVAGLLPTALLTSSTGAAATVGSGFTITPADLAFILKQIKIAEAHVANTTSATGPCGALVGPGPDQVPSPLVSYGLRTVDGSCNNLVKGQEKFGAADTLFPRLTKPVFKSAENVPPGFPGAGSATSYADKTGLVFDSEPRTVSNLIVDQTSTNPAAITAAGFPVRSQGGSPVVPCKTPPELNPDGSPVVCVPEHETLFIENVTTDAGLSPPYNSLFTIFGQFFDHGVDLTTKSGGTVFVPLKDDDPLIPGPDHEMGTGCGTPDATAACADNLPPNQRFMVLTRAQNQPGPDGTLGNGDDVQEATNTDSPWVDQSQTYTSHPSHQVFLREYVLNSANRPVATGRLLSGGPRTASTDGGMATWKAVKAQAASVLGLKLVDKDVLNIPMMSVDPYGKFIPGPARGMPQFVTDSGLVEGNLASPVQVPADAQHVVRCAAGKSCNEGFLVDIAHNAAPTGTLTADSDTSITGANGVQQPGTYDDEMLDAHFIAGDGRVNENIALTAVHQIFHSEHDRLVGDIKNVLTNDTSDSGPAALAEWKLALGAGGWNGERLFQAARFVTEMEYQHLVFEEFARKIQPAINPFQPFAFTQTELNPAVKAEFAHAVYRFGHSMLTDTISRTNANGTHNDIPLLDGFLNPPAFTQAAPNGPSGALTSEEAGGAILMGMSDQAGNELDEFVADTLRNNLLGLPLDLPTINMTRAREAGIPPLNELRKQLFSSTNDGQLKPYKNWIDWGQNLKHPESLVNFVAAYGQHPSITGATTLAGKREAARLIVSPDSLAGDVSPDDALDFLGSTGATWSNTAAGVSRTGVDGIDLWVGGLAERTNLFGGLLGSTFNYVFENQLTDLQNGDRLYYLARTPGMNLRTQLEGNSFAELVMRNTNAHSLKADAFATADCKFELANLQGTGSTVADDPASECDESAVLIRMPDGTIRYRERNTVDPSGINGQSVYNGTDGVDRVQGGNDSDTFWGGLGNDVIEGGDGGDVALGGEGNDIITDVNGDDVQKGGPGNDAMDGGPGLDILLSGDGKDFTNGGANANETFAGEGDDFTIAGQGEDAIFGDSGDDWEEGGDQPDLLQGESGNLFFLDNSNKPGHDILVGQGGDDDYDMEGGDDIGVGGPGIEKVAGASGYDWEIGQGDPQPQNQDLDLPLVGVDILTVDVRDRFNEVEALSGWNLDDTLRGDDVVPADLAGAGFIGSDYLTQAGVNRIAGLADVLPPGATAAATATTPAKTWGAGNILLGGGGADILEGRGADDILDGDKYLSVRLSVRNAAGAEIGSASIENTRQSAMTTQYLRDAAGNLTGPTLQEAVFAGTVDPGNIVAVREIKMGAAGTDTAVFSDIRANYDCIVAGVTAPCGLSSSGALTQVVHARGSAADGTDTIRGIEQLRFADSVPPSAPIIGTAVAGNASATVNWTAPLTGVVTGYSVEVQTAAGAVVGALRPAAGDVTSLVVTGLTNGQSYRFRVQAANDIGTSAFSALSNAVTPATVPNAPTIGNATAGNASATARWTPPANNGGSAITGFTVQVVNAAGAQVGALRPAGAAATSLVVTGLNNGTTYRFRVRAVNAVGSSALSALSNAVTPSAGVVTGTLPGAPIIRTALSGTTGGAITATAVWRAPTTGGAPTGYRVTAVNTAGGPNTVSAVLGTQPGVTDKTFVMTLPAGNYRFRVAAVNAAGTSPLSTASNLVTAR